MSKPAVIPDEITHVYQRIGEIVRQRRDKLGITQDELAARSGLHRTYISDIERGHRSISIATLDQLAVGIEMQSFELLRQAQVSTSPILELV